MNLSKAVGESEQRLLEKRGEVNGRLSWRQATRNQARQVLEADLALPKDERAELAAKLLASIKA